MPRPAQSRDNKQSKRPALLAALCGWAALAAAPALAETRPEQLVLISFDGAHDNALWQRSLAMAGKTGAHFTYFLSCTFLMNREARRAYKAPGQAAGRSNVGFGQSPDEVLTRLGHIWTAHQAGHEIGSHGCGHFDGKDWSTAEWQSEFEQFDKALAEGWEMNGGQAPAGWTAFATTAVKGFRAPYLSTGDGLYKALAAHGFDYDASTVSNGPAMPDLTKPVARFALPLIPEGPKARPVIAMDYNLFVRHSGGFETPSKSAEFEERALSAFRAAFEAEYSGKRRPLEIGFHFVEMNGGAYWNALDRFLTETCGRQDVACVTYQEAIRRLTPAAPNPDS